VNVASVLSSTESAIALLEHKRRSLSNTTKRTSVFEEDLELDQGKGFGEVFKFMKEQKRKREYDKYAMVNFYDVKHGKRNTIKQRLKDALPEQIVKVFENRTSGDMLLKRSRIQTLTPGEAIPNTKQQLVS
jgi:hypothetical protein